MKRLLWVVVISFVVFAPCANADSILNINITYVTATMSSNGGVFVTLIGPGTLITADGAMACQAWCHFPIPDLTSVAASEVFIADFGTAIVGGRTYNDICCLSLFSVDGSLNPSASGFVGQGETFKVLNLTLPFGNGWSFNFQFFPASGGSPAYYQFVSGSFSAGTPPVATIPEPGTVGLMATGLAGLVGVIRRKRLICLRTAN
jgi:PEP-CTERM motif